MEFSHLVQTFVMMNLRDTKTLSLYDFGAMALGLLLITNLQSLASELLRHLKPRFKEWYRNVFSPGCTRDIAFRVKLDGAGRRQLEGPTNISQHLFWFMHSRSLFDRAETTKSFHHSMFVKCVDSQTGKPISHDFQELRFPSHPTKIDPDIYVHITEEKTNESFDSSRKSSNSTSTSGSGSNESTTYVHLWISTRRNNDSYIESFLNKIETIFYAETRTSILSITDAVVDPRDTQAAFENTRFLYSTKTFDNLFFEQKDDVIKLLSQFESREAEYKRLGIPNNLTFMFHGPPGTGKTSCIKAIANYTRRDLCMVQLSSFKTNEAFVNMITAVPNTRHTRKKIYVFEEIDAYCPEEDNPFLARSDIEKPSGAASSSNIDTKDQLMLELFATSQRLKSDVSMGELMSKYTSSKNDKLSLAGILNGLDGPRETYDRICIFTTNRLHRIDPAILRPGRTDMIVYFGSLLKRDVNRYFALWFNKSIPAKTYAKMKDHTYTQAQIGKMFLKHKETPDKLYELFGENRSE